MKNHVPAALALAILSPAAGLAQECEAEFTAIQKQIEGAALQAEYQGREASHPLVLKMADGELVDLTGTIITATPYESWTGSRPVIDKVGSYAEEAKPLIESGNEEECLALLEQARADIKAFDQSDGDPNMIDNEAQEEGERTTEDASLSDQQEEPPAPSAATAVQQEPAAANAAAAGQEEPAAAEGRAASVGGSASGAAEGTIAPADEPAAASAAAEATQLPPAASGQGNSPN